MFSPTLATFLLAVKQGNLASFPSLTIYLMYKHLAKELATIMGHHCMQQNNIKSTKLETAVPLAESIDFKPLQEPANPHTSNMYASMVS